MEYIIGSLYILKNKLVNFNVSKKVPRIEPIMPWYYQYSYFYSEPTLVSNRLYLGSSFNAYNINHIKNNNINVIINVTHEIDNFHEHDDKITYYKFPILDNNQDDITPILNVTYDIIERQLSKGDVILVHCYMGASRSASVVINYLMKKLNWDYEKAKTHVLNERPLVNLSEKFDNTLKKIEIMRDCEDII